MNHRIFVAIILPDGIKRMLGNAIAELKKAALPVRFGTKNNLHLTLKFLDSRTKEEIKLIHQVLHKIVVKESPFTLALKEIQIFPSKSAAKVIAAKLYSSKRIKEITDRINQDLNKLHFLPPENRSFKSHITLARIESPLNKKEIEKVERVSLKGRWPVDSLKLMESDLSGEIPCYTVIQNYPLKHED